jgi:hypothetical protein
MMGSGAEAAQETVEYLVEGGERVELLKVRLYRPFSAKHFVEALPRTVKTIATLDRTKEAGSVGEPLHEDVVVAINEAISGGVSKLDDPPRITGGRYGLSSKEFTPAMIKSVFDEMVKDAAKNHFTVGINDDVTQTSLKYDPNFSIEPSDRTRAVFYGLGSDGTVSANKNSIKIIGEETDNYAQDYFVYDSRKAGANALELNIYYIPTSPEITSEQVEGRYESVVGFSPLLNLGSCDIVRSPAGNIINPITPIANANDKQTGHLFRVSLTLPNLILQYLLMFAMVPKRSPVSQVSARTGI